MKKDEILTGIKTLNKETLESKNPGLSLVLENGDVLENEIEKAQQQAAELQHTLDHIVNFFPQFREK
ncbi:MAG: hypothetical protein DUD32_04515 [Lactobacillus sp.]|nr:MAG: hypothetical protein DUD32_04515 [Lactobacillus sp.]